MSTSVDELESRLASNREKVLGFIRSKVDDPAVAEDILQESLLKALESVEDLEDEQKLASWFYRIVRNAIVDHHRSNQTQRKNVRQYARETDFEVTPEDEETICSCFRELLPTLKEEYREVIEAVELGDMTSEEAAEELGITRNNLNVRRYRARQKLKERLEETCRTCADHGCLDCTCDT
jgi:RNA polymerase sigma-70 factor (ECF subfamily)